MGCMKKKMLRGSKRSLETLRPDDIYDIRELDVKFGREKSLKRKDYHGCRLTHGRVTLGDSKEQTQMAQRQNFISL